MQDPHVVALHYRLETGPQLGLAEAAPLKGQTEAFTFELAEGHLRLELKAHFSMVEVAQLAVEPFLCSWEIATAFQHGIGAIRFEFERAEVLDRDPSPLGDGGSSRGARGGATRGGLRPPQDSPARYPAPPAKFTASPEVIQMWDRYQRYKAGREPLGGMAQFCLTTIGLSAGGRMARKAAAAQYAIDFEVLRCLARLTSVVGDAQTGRNPFKGGGFRAHAPAEVAWVEAVVKRLIQRAGEWAADPSTEWPQITMEDFDNL